MLYRLIRRRKDRPAMEKKDRCRLLNDMVAEILDSRRRVIAWDAFLRSGGWEDEEVEIEVRRIGAEQAAAGFNGASIAAKYDISESEWAPPGKSEMCDTVLQIERMILRVLVEETIGGLVEAGDGIGRRLLPGKLLV